MDPNGDPLPSGTSELWISVETFDPILLCDVDPEAGAPLAFRVGSARRQRLRARATVRRMSRVHTLLVLALASCPRPIPADPTSSGFTEGKTDPPPPEPLLVCPGETQCPCGGAAVDDSGGEVTCPGEALLCGPFRACTNACRSSADCTSGVAGESCHGSVCIVPCDPAVPSGGCPDAGMPGSTCIKAFDNYACGYPPP